MSYELAGSRILTPAIGSSSYVWTSIIGVVIAALSFGYIIGGHIADKRNKSSDLGLLLIASSFGIIITLLLIEPVSNVLVSLRLDVRLEAVLAATILFAPTSIILGAVGPYTAKLHTTSLKTTGGSIAMLSALNSLGGIVGTFLTGFLFFGFMGSRMTLGFLVVLLLITALVATKLPKYMLKLVLLISLSGLLIASSPTNALVTTFDTSIANYEVKDIPSSEGTLRVLTMGPGGYQSGIYLNNPNKLAFSYAQNISDAIAQRQQPTNILVLGGGSFTLPSYLANAYPNSSIDVVELDSHLIYIAREYFMYKDPANVHVINQDARTYVTKTQTKYDVIVIDVFSDAGIPFTVSTIEFTRALSDKLQDNGMVMMNIIAGQNNQCAALFDGFVSSFKNSFDWVATTPVTFDTLEARQNILLFASQHTPTDINVAGLITPIAADEASFSDDFAPIERHHHNCQSS